MNNKIKNKDIAFVGFIIDKEKETLVYSIVNQELQEQATDKELESFYTKSVPFTMELVELLQRYPFYENEQENLVYVGCFKFMEEAKIIVPLFNWDSFYDQLGAEEKETLLDKGLAVRDALTDLLDGIHSENQKAKDHAKYGLSIPLALDVNDEYFNKKEKLEEELSVLKKELQDLTDN